MDSDVPSGVLHRAPSKSVAGGERDLHWLADVVADGLMGWTIGKVVGEGFAAPPLGAGGT